MPRRKADKIDKVIGANIARYRTLKGLSQSGMGEALPTKLSHQAVDKYETGLTRVPASSLVEIAAVLGCDVATLFEGITKALPKSNTGRTAEELFKHFNSIQSNALKLAIGNLAKAIASEAKP